MVNDNANNNSICFHQEKKDNLIEHIRCQIHNYGLTLKSLQKDKDTVQSCCERDMIALEPTCTMVSFWVNKVRLSQCSQCKKNPKN